MIGPEEREEHHRWLLELTQIPTAAGREGRVINWVRRWAGERQVTLTEDAAGNLHIAATGSSAAPGPPIYFTAHLDHPAFVVERVIGPGTVQLALRGGVMDDYFEEARVVIHDGRGGRHSATLSGRPDTGCAVFKSYLAELDG